MKKLILFFSMLLMAVAVFCQAADSTLVPALTGVGISKTASWLIAGALSLLIGHVAVPQKWTSILAYVEKFLYLLYSALVWFNEKTNKLSKKQERERLKKLELESKLKVEQEKIMMAMNFKKPVLTIGLLLIGVLSMNAQDPWANFWKPIDANSQINTLRLKSDNIKAETETETTLEASAWLFRPSVALSAVAIDFSGDDPASLSLSSVGFGLSYGKFTTVNDEAYCNYSFNAFLLTTMEFGEETDANLGLAGTIDVFNKLIGVGVGAYMSAGKIHPMLLTTISYSF